MTRRKFRPAAWAVAVVALLGALMIALGIWQLRRGFAKQALLDHYTQAATQPPQHIDSGKVAYPGQIEHAYVRGFFDTTRQLLLDNQSHDGRPGYHVWTPLLQDDGSTVIVDRGWIPLATAQLPTVLAAPDTRTEVRGYWRTLPVPGMRLEADNCAERPWPRLVEYPTLDDLHCLYGAYVAPGVLLMEPAAADGYVRDWQAAPELNPVKHYGYAAQWFAFTLTLLVIFVKLSFRAPPPRP